MPRKAATTARAKNKALAMRPENEALDESVNGNKITDNFKVEKQKQKRSPRVSKAKKPLKEEQNLKKVSEASEEMSSTTSTLPPPNVMELLSVQQPIPMAVMTSDPAPPPAAPTSVTAKKGAKKRKSGGEKAPSAAKNKGLAVRPENMEEGKNGNKITDHFKVEKPKQVGSQRVSKAKKPMTEEQKLKRFKNQFGGMTKEEVCARGLPDYLRPDLDLVFIGINPSLSAAYSGKYYDGVGNHFWQALHLSGFIPYPMGPQDDHKMMDFNIGFTNVVARTTPGLADLKKSEIREGAEILREKLAKYKPKIAVFNGKAIYEVYSGQKKFMFGKQPEKMEGTDTWVWVMPSSSARCAQLPRAIDKVPFYEALKKFRDFVTGKSDEPHEEEIVFANVVLKNFPRKPTIKQEPEDPDCKVENGAGES